MSWKTPVDGKPCVIGAAMVESGQLDSDGFPVSSGNTGTLAYSVLMPLESFQDAWKPYRTIPPLNRVYSGDDPSDPRSTIELVFPDEATAQTVLSSLWTPDT